MPAQKKNLVHDADTTFRLDLWYTKANGEKNLVGSTITFILSNPGEKTPLFTYTYDGTVDGHILVKVSDELTKTWDMGKYAYRLDITGEDGETSRILFGALDVKSGVDV